ncbi:hypothetical protein CEE37_02760 [candidate division LCP-89 bacterium B3_LCP]|uniref:Secretion system C-terminal sorting domain-containing protein n=1 Tax=candidate division LCP-89 bacterium B3_LCP TaxID=2012998 RepID=A0A532V2Q7_UNCL8|nr:MAG: hypothetical protein CEE37_02760 [candidate division LCP-89 bacterium B3_LCP]
MRAKFILLLLPTLLLALPYPLSAQWTPDPYDGMVTVTNEPGNQSNIEILSLSGNNTILVWQSTNNWPLKYYYQVLDLRGRALLPENGVPLIDGNWEYGWGYGGLMPDGEGGCIAVFDDWRDGSRQIYGQRIDARGSRLWGENGLPLAIWPEYDLNSLDIAYDSLGNFFVCFTYETIQSDYYLYAQKFDNNGNCHWGPYGIPICTYGGYAIFSEAVQDEEGGILIVWEDSRQSGSYYERLFYFQHLDAAGNPLLLENGIQIRLASESLDCCHDGVSDGQGGGIWSWQKSGPGIDSELAAFRLSGDGRTIWEWYGGIVCTRSFLEMKSHPDDGNIWLSDNEDRTGQYVGYIYCFTADGTPLFGDEGLPYGGWLVPAPGGIITIYSPYSEVRSVLSAQYVHNDGNPGWKTTMAQCDTLGQALTGQCGAPDGFGGAVVAIYDDRIQTAGHDIAAQRVCWDGQVAWTKYKPPTKITIIDAVLNYHNGILSYNLPQAGIIKLDLFDVLGRRIETLAESYKDAGQYNIHINNTHLPSGIYLTKLTSPVGSHVAKMVVVR